MKTTYKTAIIVCICTGLASLGFSSVSSQDYIEAYKAEHRDCVLAPIEVVAPESTSIIGEEVVVDLTFKVNADGKPIDIHVAQTTESRAADAAQKALKQWRFKPFKIDGKPFMGKVSLQVHFVAPSE